MFLTDHLSAFLFQMAALTQHSVGTLLPSSSRLGELERVLAELRALVFELLCDLGQKEHLHRCGDLSTRCGWRWRSHRSLSLGITLFGKQFQQTCNALF